MFTTVEININSLTNSSINKSIYLERGNEMVFERTLIHLHVDAKGSKTV